MGVILILLLAALASAVAVSRVHNARLEREALRQWHDEERSWWDSLRA